VNNVQLGIWLFLASEVMLFGGLFSAYFTLRASAVEPWLPMHSHSGSPVLATINLLLGSLAFAAATHATRTGGRVKFVRTQLLMSLLWGFAFCVFKAGEYSGLFEAHLLPSTSTQMASYFLLTGVHVVHVIGGMVVGVWLLLTLPAELSPAFANRMRATALYWYFVDIVWLMIATLFYVV